MSRIERAGRIELRFQPGDDTDLDEVVMNKGEASIHLERMDKHDIWMGLYAGDYSVHLHIGPSDKHRIDCVWEDAGATYKEKPGKDEDGNTCIGPVTICHDANGDFEELFFTTAGVQHLHMQKVERNKIWMKFTDGDNVCHVWVNRTKRQPVDVSRWKLLEGDKERKG